VVSGGVTDSLDKPETPGSTVTGGGTDSLDKPGDEFVARSEDDRP
jgi:hypothetical protein